jgi:hypothetical protein
LHRMPVVGKKWVQCIDMIAGVDVRCEKPWNDIHMDDCVRV